MPDYKRIKVLFLPAPIFSSLPSVINFDFQAGKILIGKDAVAQTRVFHAGHKLPGVIGVDLAPG